MERHVLIFPFPAQGHIKPMLCLAELLCQAGLLVTFLNSHHNHRRLNNLRHLSTRFPTLRFESISDGLPDHHPRNLLHFMDMVHSIKKVTKPLFQDLLLSVSHNSDIPPVSCIIVDGIMSFAINVAKELQIQVINFRTISACCLLSYLDVPKLVGKGELPFSDKEMDHELSSVTYAFELKHHQDPNFQFFVSETQSMNRASAVILNTFESLEAPVLSQMTPLLPKLYTIGPLHALWKSRIVDSSQLSSSNGNLRETDRNCMAWLDSQPSRSVVYVSFGSYIVLTSEELFEVWHGLTKSDKPYLWVIRQDDHEYDTIPTQISLGKKHKHKDKGFIVDWAPQEEVLAHPSLGGFLTHCGWNSTLESMVGGIPIACLPKLPDQFVNTKWVSEVWKNGVYMKDFCNRSTVEMMVRALMDNPREEIMTSVDGISKLARQSVEQGGSSFRNFEMLVGELKTS